MPDVTRHLVLVEADDASPPPGRLAMWITAATSAQVVTGALRVSAVVGTVLNLLNQGGTILADPIALDPVQGFLNYLVPYLVSTYAASRLRVLDQTTDDDDDISLAA